MKWVGLTGGIGTGKTTAAQILAENGVPVVDADRIAREVIQKGTPGFLEVIKTFGSVVLGPDGDINRTRLGEIVFSDPQQRDVLETIVHPLIRARTARYRKDLAAQGHSFAVYDVPLLFEKSMKEQFDLVLVVACSPELQIERAMRRTGLPRPEIERRISSQIPLDQKVRAADVVFQNDGTLEDLRSQILAWLKDYQDQL